MLVLLGELSKLRVELLLEARAYFRDEAFFFADLADIHTLLFAQRFSMLTAQRFQSFSVFTLKLAKSLSVLTVHLLQSLRMRVLQNAESLSVLITRRLKLSFKSLDLSEKLTLRKLRLLSRLLLSECLEFLLLLDFKRQLGSDQVLNLRFVLLIALLVLFLEFLHDFLCFSLHFEN